MNDQELIADREPLIRILDREGAQTGDCGHEPGDIDDCSNGCWDLLTYYADAILASKWLAGVIADAKADERNEWADWIDSVTSYVGPPVTAEEIAVALRSKDRPFGVAELRKGIK